MWFPPLEIMVYTVNLRSLVCYIDWRLSGRVSVLHSAVVISISSGRDHDIHCWWNLIRSEQLSSVKNWLCIISCLSGRFGKYGFWMIYLRVQDIFTEEKKKSTFPFFWSKYLCIVSSLVNLRSLVCDVDWQLSGRVPVLYSVVAISISIGRDHGIHCWWDLIKSKQLSSVSVCGTQMFAGFSDHGNSIHKKIFHKKGMWWWF